MAVAPDSGTLPKGLSEGPLEGTAVTGLTLRRALGMWFLLFAGLVLLFALRDAMIANMQDPKLVYQLSAIVAAILVLIATFKMVDRLETNTTKELLLVGTLWAVLTGVLSVVFAHWLLKRDFGLIFQDWDLLNGRLYLLVLGALFLGPYLMTRLHGIEERDEEGYLRR